MKYIYVYSSLWLLPDPSLPSYPLNSRFFSLSANLLSVLPKYSCVWGLPQRPVDLPGVTPLKKTNYPSLHSYSLPIGPYPGMGLHAHLHPCHPHVGILSGLNLFWSCVRYYNCCKFVCATALLSTATAFHVSRAVRRANNDESIQTWALSFADYSNKVGSKQSYHHMHSYWYESDTEIAQDPWSTRSPEDLAWPGK